MINKSKITCVNNITNNAANNEENEGNNNLVMETRNCCGWIGMVKEWDSHYNKECEYTRVSCDYCNTHSCIRKLMESHLNIDCPLFIVKCPLGCHQQPPKRCEIKNHLENDCPKYLLACENIGCNLEIERQEFKQHISDECDYRLVSCTYAKYGCIISHQFINENLLPICELEQHMLDMKIDHITLQVLFCLSANQYINHVVCIFFNIKIQLNCVTNQVFLSYDLFLYEFDECLIGKEIGR